MIYINIYKYIFIYIHIYNIYLFIYNTCIHILREVISSVNPAN